jgi:hypothetical protein
MASSEFVSRFKNKTFVLGKAGILPIINQNPINKSVVPSSKLHIAPELQILRPLNKQPTPPPLSRICSEKTSKGTLRSYSKSPLPLFPNTYRSISPLLGMDSKDYINKSSGLSKFSRISSGTGIDVMKIIKN